MNPYTSEVIDRTGADLMRQAQMQQNQLGEFLKESSHYKRLNRLKIFKDIDFCLQHSVYDCLPRLENNVLVV